MEGKDKKNMTQEDMEFVQLFYKKFEEYEKIEAEKHPFQKILEDEMKREKEIKDNKILNRLSSAVSFMGKGVAAMGVMMFVNDSVVGADLFPATLMTITGIAIGLSAKTSQRNYIESESFAEKNISKEKFVSDVEDQPKVNRVAYDFETEQYNLSALSAREFREENTPDRADVELEIDFDLEK